MIRDRTHLTRQMDIIPLDALDTPVTIIGAGAIGSFVALSLAKMGMENLTVFDDDIVSIENMNCQFYPLWSVGLPKCMVLEDMLESFTKVKIRAVHEKYQAGRFPGIVVSAVDSMKARKLIFDEHRDQAFRTRTIVDARMGPESALLYVYNPTDTEDCKAYETSLYSDDDAVQERCTAKSTMYTVNGITYLVVKAIKDSILNKRGLSHATWDIEGNQTLCFNKAAPESAVQIA